MRKQSFWITIVWMISFGILLLALTACAPEEAPIVEQPTEENIQSLEIKPAVGEVSSPEPALEIEEAEQIPSAKLPESGASLSQVQPQATPEDTQLEVGSEAPSQMELPAVDPGPLPPVDPTIGNLAPEFTLTTLDGQTVSLAELRGKPVVLNYWVTWCVPCREEMPSIEAIQNEYIDQGLVVLSVNGTKQDSLGDVKELVQELGISFPVLLDEKESVYNSYRVLFMPTSFFIDSRGVIQDIVLGSTSEEGFRTRVEKLVSPVN